MPIEKSHKTFVRLLWYLKAYKLRIIGGLVCTTFMGLADAALAPLIGILIKMLSQISVSLSETGAVRAVMDSLTIDRFGLHYEILPSYIISSDSQARNVLFAFGAFVTALMLFKGFFVYSKEYLMSSAIQKTVKRLRDRLFAHLLFLKMHFFEQGKTGDIMSRLSTDVQTVEQSLASIVILAQAAIHSLIFLTALLVTDWQLTLFAMIVFPLSAGVVKLFSDAIRRASRKIMANLADINSFVQEKVTAIKIIKTYNLEQYEKEQFFQKTYSNYSHSMRANRLIAFLKPSNEFLSTVGMMAIILFCGSRILNQQMDITVFSVFAVLISLAYKPIKTLGNAQPVIQRAMAASERIFELLDQEPEKTNGMAKNLPEHIRGEVVFKNVTFSYNGRDKVLNNLSLYVEPGETIALVGPSGVGKSTMIHLLLRFYECRTGIITIDGINIKTVRLQSLRRAMSLVPQETILFSGSVRENIRYGSLEATDEDIENAARAANAHEFIEKLSEGYDTEIGERGVQISGGQRQRIAIARAVLRDSPILLLDEATSALDTESEKLVQEATNNLMRERTTFVIAHRLTTVKNAGKIAVMDRGTVIQLGNHEELINQEGLYKSLYELQFT